MCGSLPSLPGQIVLVGGTVTLELLEPGSGSVELEKLWKWKEERGRRGRISLEMARRWGDKVWEMPSVSCHIEVNVPEAGLCLRTL